MATSTTNLGLTKPAGTDKIRIAQINGNMDILDEKIGAVGNTSLQAQVTSQNEALSKVRIRTNLGNLSSLSSLQTAISDAASTMEAGESILVSFYVAATFETFKQFYIYEGYLFCNYVSGTRRDLSVTFNSGFSDNITIGRFNGTWNYSDLNSKICSFYVENRTVNTDGNGLATIGQGSGIYYPVAAFTKKQSSYHIINVGRYINTSNSESYFLRITGANGTAIANETDYPVEIKWITKMS